MAEPGAAIRVMLVDEHPIFVGGLRQLIEEAGDLTIVGHENSGLRALKRAQELAPDVVVTGITLPELNGLVLTQRLVAALPALRVVILTAQSDRAYIQRALEAGARGYVLKRSPGGNLLHAIGAVATGGTYIDPALAGRLLMPAVRLAGRPPLPAADPGVRSLTVRESEVVRLLALGHTNKEIAAQLSVTVKSVETYRARACGKLNLRARAQLVRYAATHGWLSEL
jgi:DNA-binding NarL/FixJ family response regulator